MDRKETAAAGMTLQGVAVAVVALARFVGSTDPTLAPYLKQALASAEAVGLASIDLALLQTIIAALTKS